MLVAIAISGDRVCGRLDCATELMLVDTAAEAESSVKRIDIRDWPARGRATRLRQLGVSVLVCGAVCRFDAACVEQVGLRLIAGVSGPIDRVLEAVLAGTLSQNAEFWGEDIPTRRRRCHRGGDSGGGRRRRQWNRGGMRTDRDDDVEA